VAKISKHGGPTFGPDEQPIVRPEIGYVDRVIAEDVAADDDSIAGDAEQAQTDKPTAKPTPHKKATGKK